MSTVLSRHSERHEHTGENEQPNRKRKRGETTPFDEKKFLTVQLHQFIGVLLEEEKLFNHILRAFVFHVGSYLKSSSSLLILRIFQHKFQE